MLDEIVPFPVLHRERAEVICRALAVAPHALGVCCIPTLPTPLIIRLVLDPVAFCITKALSADVVPALISNPSDEPDVLDPIILAV